MLDFSTRFWFADLLVLIFLIVWPALKTVSALESGVWRGRWAQYWVGICFILGIMYVLRVLCAGKNIIEFVEIIGAVAFSVNNGAAVRFLTKWIIAPLYQTNLKFIEKTIVFVRSLPKWIYKFIRNEHK